LERAARAIVITLAFFFSAGMEIFDIFDCVARYIFVQGIFANCFAFPGHDALMNFGSS